MNLVILQGNIGTAPKKIGENTYSFPLAIHQGNETIWVDCLFHNESLGLGLSAGTQVLVNGSLVTLRDVQKGWKIKLESVEIKKSKFNESTEFKSN